MFSIKGNVVNASCRLVYCEFIVVINSVCGVYKICNVGAICVYVVFVCKVSVCGWGDIGYYFLIDCLLVPYAWALSCGGRRVGAASVPSPHPTRQLLPSKLTSCPAARHRHPSV